MSMYTALTGVSASQAEISAISHNIANVGTYGFKGSRVEFADIFSSSPLEVGRTSTGLGVQTGRVTQVFTQGNVTTNNCTAGQLTRGAGGKIDVAGTCTQNGQTVDMAMTGTMAAKKTDVTVTTKGKVPTGGDMEMVMQMTSSHTGPCKAPATT